MTTDQQPPGDRATATTSPSLIEAIRIDVVRLHESWMSLAFPRQRDAKHSVLGKWTPNTTAGMAKYRFWGAVGVIVLAVLYPLTVFGFAIRFYSRRIDRATASLGFIGVILLSLLVWGALSAATYFSRISFEGFVAVAAAGGVATLSAVVALFFSRVGGRFTTVFLAYPFGVTALFLPPVVAALYSPTLGNVIFPGSENIAIWLLDNVLDIYGLNDYIRATFDLEGLAYVGMWFTLAVPVGWVLGVLVSLANVVRPSGASGEPSGG